VWQKLWLYLKIFLLDYFLLYRIIILFISCGSLIESIEFENFGWQPWRQDRIESVSSPRLLSKFSNSIASSIILSLLVTEYWIKIKDVRSWQSGSWNSSVRSLRMSALHGLVLKRIPRFIPEPRNIFCTVPLSKRPKVVKKILNTDNKNSYTWTFTDFYQFFNYIQVHI